MKFDADGIRDIETVAILQYQRDSTSGVYNTHGILFHVKIRCFYALNCHSRLTNPTRGCNCEWHKQHSLLNI